MSHEPNLITTTGSRYNSHDQGASRVAVWNSGCRFFLFFVSWGRESRRNIRLYSQAQCLIICRPRASHTNGTGPDDNFQCPTQHEAVPEELQYLSQPRNTLYTHQVWNRQPARCQQRVRQDSENRKDWRITNLYNFVNVVQSWLNCTNLYTLCKFVCMIQVWTHYTSLYKSWQIA